MTNKGRCTGSADPSRRPRTALPGLAAGELPARGAGTGPRVRAGRAGCRGDQTGERPRPHRVGWLVVRPGRGPRRRRAGHPAPRRRDGRRRGTGGDRAGQRGLRPGHRPCAVPAAAGKPDRRRLRRRPRRRRPGLVGRQDRGRARRGRSRRVDQIRAAPQPPACHRRHGLRSRDPGRGSGAGPDARRPARRAARQRPRAGPAASGRPRRVHRDAARVDGRRRHGLAGTGRGAPGRLRRPGPAPGCGQRTARRLPADLRGPRRRARQVPDRPRLPAAARPGDDRLRRAAPLAGLRRQDHDRPGPAAARRHRRPRRPVLAAGMPAVRRHAGHGRHARSSGSTSLAACKVVARADVPGRGSGRRRRPLPSLLA